VSDNTAYAILARYAIRSVKMYAGYEHMTYANPKDPLANGTATIGGYVLSVINNTAFTIHKVLQYAWIGARYSITPSLDVSGRLLSISPEQLQCQRLLRHQLRIVLGPLPRRLTCSGLQALIAIRCLRRCQLLACRGWNGFGIPQRSQLGFDARHTVVF